MANYPVSGQLETLLPVKYGDNLGFDGKSSPTAGTIKLSKIGDIGFQFEGGLITVAGYANRVDISFDRMMIYDGSFAHVPGGIPFDIAQPTLEPTYAKVLTVPIIVADQTTTLLSVVGEAGDVKLTFDKAVNYGGSWTQTPGGSSYIIAQPTQNSPTNTILNIPITAGAALPRTLITAKSDATGIILNYDGPILIDGAIDYGTTVNGIRIVSGSQPDGSSIHLVASFATSGSSEWFPTPQSFVGAGVLPYVTTAYAETSKTFVLIFSEEVTESSATNPGNYAIVPALDILSITKINATTYRMTTSTQTASTTYQVTLTGILDRANNPI